MKTKRLVALCGRVSEKANQLIIAELKKQSLDAIAPSHGDILYLLFSEQPYEMGEIAKKIYRTKPTVTVLVDKLVKHGYVQKVKSIQDARYTSVIITPKGLALKPIFQEISDKLNNVVCKDIEDSDTFFIETLLEKAIKNFEK